MTTARPTPEVRAVFGDLARIVYAGSSTTDVYQAIIDAAPRLVSGCDHASLMLRDGNRFWTGAVSDATAQQVDHLEREVGEGPCIDALQGQEYAIDTDIASESTWPELGRRVVAETPVRGMIGFRLFREGTKAGALNIFSDHPGVLDADSADEGALLAAFTAVTIAAAHQREEAESLRAGLLSNREIGQAIGLLMAAHQCTAEEAFGVLRRISSEFNRKLAVVAREILDHHEQR